MKDYQFPEGKVPNANYTSTDVVTTTSGEELFNTVYCKGIAKHQPVLIIVLGTVAVGASSVKVDIDIVAGDTYTDADIGEPSEALCTAAKDHTFLHAVTQQAYQENPIYSATIIVASAAANCTIQSSALIVIPIGVV